MNYSMLHYQYLVLQQTTKCLQPEPSVFYHHLLMFAVKVDFYYPVLNICGNEPSICFVHNHFQNGPMNVCNFYLNIEIPLQFFCL